MKFRHEWKHRISYVDYLTLRARLSAVLRRDVHGADGRYLIRSLYFDDAKDTALQEKIHGVNLREKFRIRCYNGDSILIRLEKKSKINGLCNKVSALLSAEETERLLADDRAWMPAHPAPLVRELYTKMRCKGLRPKTIVDYTRDAFVFPAGNVRVTLDFHIRTGLCHTDFLDPNCVTIPAGEEVYILEVKWDEFLPDVVRDAVQLPGRSATAFSKYAACRIYG